MNRRVATLFSASALTAILHSAAGFAGPEAPSSKPMKVWNLTASTILDFRIAPRGSKTFGRNLALDDKDKEIDIDERLTLRNVKPGNYDARVTLKDGRQCRVEGLKLEAGGIASIEEKDLGGCLR